MELKNFLSRWSAESRVFLSRCISRERSEDTLQRLLEKVNRVPLHEDFHFRVTNGQRAEVKRACTAKEYPCFLRPIRHKEVFFFTSVSPQQLLIHPTTERILCTLSSDSISTSAMASKGYPSFCIWKAISCFVEAFPNSLPSVIPSSFP